MWTTYFSFWDDFVDPLKVTFDGDNRKIYLNTQYSTFRIKEDIYAATKRWLERRQNLSYLPPLRSIGGDVTGSGQYAGDLYFLINGWQIVVTHLANITGSLFNDDVNTPSYLILSGGGVISTVSSLAYSYNVSLGVTVPTAAEISDKVWSTNPDTYSATTTAGKLNTINQNTANIKADTTNIISLTA